MTRINPGNHPMDRATQSHLTYRSSTYFDGERDEDEFFAWRRAFPVVLGHDVWVGHGAIVLAGRAVGTGAVIAAGAASLIKTALALHRRTLPPTINFTAPTPKIDFARTPFKVQTQLTPWPNGAGPRRAPRRVSRRPAASTTA